jgi:hypothetical protein
LNPPTFGFFSRVKRPCLSAFYFRAARLIRARHRAFGNAYQWPLLCVGLFFSFFGIA